VGLGGSNQLGHQHRGYRDRRNNLRSHGALLANIAALKQLAAEASVPKDCGGLAASSGCREFAQPSADHA
jgi:hypothetical protein